MDAAKGLSEQKNLGELVLPSQVGACLGGKQVFFKGNEFDDGGGGVWLRGKKMLLQQGAEAEGPGRCSHFSVRMLCDKQPPNLSVF